MNWDEAAKEMGYPGAKEMFQDLYVAKKRSLQDLCVLFQATNWAVKKQLTDHGIPVKKRGGPNATKFVMSEEDYQQVLLQGVPAYAKARGVSKDVIWRAVRKRKGQQQPCVETSSPAPAQPSEPDPSGNQ